MSKKEPKGYYERFKAIVWGEPKPPKRRALKRRARKRRVVEERVPKREIRIPSVKEIRELKKDYPEREGFYMVGGRKVKTGMAAVLTRAPYKREIEADLKTGKTKLEAHRRRALSGRYIGMLVTGERKPSKQLAIQLEWKRRQTDQYYEWFRHYYFEDWKEETPIARFERRPPISLEKAKEYARDMWHARKKLGLKRLWLKIISPD